MCEIQVIKKFGGKLNLTDVQNFFHMLRLGGQGNRDAYGFFTQGGYYQRRAGNFSVENQQIVGAYTTNILKQNPSFIVGHNRLATQGDKNKNFNNHPFPTEDWIIVHNGVLSNDDDLIKEHNLEYKHETDSAVAVHLLQKYTNEKVAPLEAIKKVAEQLQGSFSIAAYHKTTDRLFYFKNASPRFGFRLFFMSNGEKVLVGSTDVGNFEELYASYNMIFNDPLYEKYLQVDAGDNTIYEINHKEIKEVGTFTPKPPKTYYGTPYKGATNQPSSYSTATAVKRGGKWVTYGGIYDTDWDDVPTSFREGKDLEIKDYNQFEELSEVAVNEKICDAAETMQNQLNNSLGVDFSIEVIPSEKKVLFEAQIETESVGLQTIMEEVSNYTNGKAKPTKNGFSIGFRELIDEYY